MSETQREDPIYPGTLDVVNYRGSEHQVIACAQTIDPNQDIFVLKNISTGEVIRVKDAVFTPLQTTRTPGAGNVHLRNEGVRVTGSIEGGKIVE